MQIRKAELIEKNHLEVDSVLNIVKTMKEGGVPWDKILRMVNDAKKTGDPLANLINGMNFEKDSITVLLQDYDDLETDEMIGVEVEISLNSFQNAK